MGSGSGQGNLGHQVIQLLDRVWIGLPISKVIGSDVDENDIRGLKELEPTFDLLVDLKNAPAAVAIMVLLACFDEHAVGKIFFASDHIDVKPCRGQLLVEWRTVAAGRCGSPSDGITDGIDDQSGGDIKGKSGGGKKSQDQKLEAGFHGGGNFLNGG